MKWIDYKRNLWDRQKLPSEKRFVLVQTNGLHKEGLPPAVAVGYMKFAAGCKDSPIFIVPGVRCGEVVSWCDCLGDDFKAPLWGAGNG